MPPDWLSARAAEIFAGLVSVIEEMGIASASDTAALALAASRLEEVEICTDVIEDGGRTFVSSAEYDGEGRVTSQQVKDTQPLPSAARRCGTLNPLLGEFGLTRPRDQGVGEQETRG